MSELLLLSGGIDSIALAAWRRPCLCLTVDYGQRAAIAEIRASIQVCRALGLRHEVLTANIASLAAGDMSPYAASLLSPHSEFWPYRNQYLATLAGMYAIKESCDTVLIGTVATDSRHRDGTPRFVEGMDDLLRWQEGSLRFVAPAILMTSEQLVQESRVELSVLAWAHSCHVSELACGRCRGCEKHSKIMMSLGIQR